MSIKPHIQLLVTEPLVTGRLDTISEIPIDCRFASSAKYSATVTDNPVEEGSVISDHVQIQPTGIDIEGLVSDTPLTSMPNTILRMKGDNREDRRPLRSQGAFDAIKASFRNKVPITVVREYETLEDMIITSFVQSKSADQGNGLWFTMTLRKIITVKTLTGALPADVVARLKRRRAKTQAATPDSVKTVRDRTSAKGQRGRQAPIIREGLASSLNSKLAAAA